MCYSALISRTRLFSGSFVSALMVADTFSLGVEGEDVMYPTWGDFWETLAWGLGGLGIGLITRIQERSSDPARIRYNLLRFAKYGGYISGTALIIVALEMLATLLH